MQILKADLKLQVCLMKIRTAFLQQDYVMLLLGIIFFSVKHIVQITPQ